MQRTSGRGRSVLSAQVLATQRLEWERIAPFKDKNAKSGRGRNAPIHRTRFEFSHRRSPAFLRFFTQTFLQSLLCGNQRRSWTGQILGIERVCPLWRKLRRFGPLIGLRAFLSLTKKLSLEGDRYRWLRRWLSLHIVGVGDEQASAWPDCFAFTYVFSSQRYVSADYKVLDNDYYHNGRAHDARFNDPVLGVTIRF